ncbi:MAG: hypothetical protein ABI454_09875 [Sphingomicrobium sp.]
MTSLADIVVVNENADEATAGDVTVFRNAEAACGWLEHWWVENGEGSAFTASGERLTLGVDHHDRVVVVDREAAAEGTALVESWLRSAAAAVLQARRVKAARGKVVLNQSEQEGRLPTSVEELVAYVGFTA